jgi:trimeric autotransporter adhesin
MRRRPRHLENTMKRMLSGMALIACAALPRAALAQDEPILLQARSGPSLGDRVLIDSAGGAAFMGQLGIGLVPMEGPGVRMMWHPYRGAFRAGEAASSEWNDSNIGFYSVAGGYRSLASGLGSMAMGDSNYIESGAPNAAAFGSRNRVGDGPASGQHSLLFGRNNVSLDSVGVAFGDGNAMDARRSFLFGYRNSSRGENSVALGYYSATLQRTGSFVASDASSTDTIGALTANNQFSARYSGGYRWYTNAIRSLGVQLLPNATSWSVLSDRNRKRDFRDLEPEDVLARIRRAPVSTWRYDVDTDPSVLHMGPMAQDWQRAFGLNADSLMISQADMDGATLAGIQALDQMALRRQAQIERLRAENAGLRKELDSARSGETAETAALRARLERIEAALLQRGL